MELAGPKIKELVNALAHAFLDVRDLEKMVTFHLSEHIAEGEINWKQGVADVAFDLVKALREEEKAALLIAAAFAEKPGSARIRAIHDQLPEWVTSPAATAARDQTRSALREARTRRTPSTQREEPRSIDWNVVISFDLLDQDFFFQKRLMQKTGAIAFALGGQRSMLKDYVIERVKQVIAKDGRTILRKDAYLVARGLPTLPNGQSPIASVIADACDCARIADLFDQPQLDILLVIWNYDIPLAEMKRMAIAFWNDLAVQVAANLEGHQRRLIALWVNSNQDPLDTFHVVPAIAPFDVKEVTEHIQNQLELAGVDAKRIEYYVATLHGLGGVLPDSFDLMIQIVEEVSGGNGQ